MKPFRRNRTIFFWPNEKISNPLCWAWRMCEVNRNCCVGCCKSGRQWRSGLWKYGFWLPFLVSWRLMGFVGLMVTIRAKKRFCSKNGWFCTLWWINHTSFQSLAFIFNLLQLSRNLVSMVPRNDFWNLFYNILADKLSSYRSEWIEL